MTPHLLFPVHEASQVGEVRRRAAQWAHELGFDSVAAGRLALVATELGGNLVRHAQDGRLLLARRDGPDGIGVELLSLDAGPGMADVAACLADGFSTAGTPGTGLGAARRLADEFDIFSAPGKGTVIAARVKASASPATVNANARPRFSFAGLCLAAPGETVSGDSWAATQRGEQAAMMLADGLGHGPDAAKAADAATATFEHHAFAAPGDFIDKAHAALRGSRGAALSVVALDAQQGSVSFCGAGNVAGRLISGLVDRSMLSQHGTVGLQIRRPQATLYDWPEHAIVVLHSDGLLTRWNLQEVPGLLRCDVAVIAGWLMLCHRRGRDDATVLVARRH